MRWEQAEDMYERVLEMDPRHYQTLCNYALLQSIRDDGKGHPDHSSMMYEEATSVAPKTARTQVTPQQESISLGALATGQSRGARGGGSGQGGGGLEMQRSGALQTEFGEFQTECWSPKSLARAAPADMHALAESGVRHVKAHQVKEAYDAARAAARDA
mmetsp:Transcript_26355/g.42303  ORF Transcript_26355/g.42303 Transcript_26355/m.42303 type:complete len:159 (+) Transcript_26355:542-1018(+)